MNRRDFLTRFGIGVGAALVLAKLPESAIAGLSTEQAAKRCATAFMTHRWNAETKGKGSANRPRIWFVGQELYDAYESELPLVRRWSKASTMPGIGDGSPTLVFKADRLIIKGNGWYMDPVPQPAVLPKWFNVGYQAT